MERSNTMAYSSMTTEYNSRIINDVITKKQILRVHVSAMCSSFPAKTILLFGMRAEMDMVVDPSTDYQRVKDRKILL